MNITAQDRKETVEFGKTIAKVWNKKYAQKISFGRTSKYTCLSFAKFKNFDVNEIEFRDEDKNLIKLRFPHMNIDAGIWPHGIGDGQKPNVARTWTFDICIQASMRPYRCKYFHPMEYLKYHAYKRSRIDALASLFYVLDNHSQWKKYLTPNKNKKQKF